MIDCRLATRHQNCQDGSLWNSIRMRVTGFNNCRLVIEPRAIHTAEAKRSTTRSPLHATCSRGMSIRNFLHWVDQKILFDELCKECNFNENEKNMMQYSVAIKGIPKSIDTSLRQMSVFFVNGHVCEEIDTTYQTEKPDKSARDKNCRINVKIHKADDDDCDKGFKKYELTSQICFSRMKNECESGPWAINFDALKTGLMDLLPELNNIIDHLKKQCGPATFNEITYDDFVKEKDRLYKQFMGKLHSIHEENCENIRAMVRPSHLTDQEFQKLKKKKSWSYYKCSTNTNRNWDFKKKLTMITEQFRQYCL